MYMFNDAFYTRSRWMFVFVTSAYVAAAVGAACVTLPWAMIGSLLNALPFAASAMFERLKEYVPRV